MKLQVQGKGMQKQTGENKLGARAGTGSRETQKTHMVNQIIHDEFSPKKVLLQKYSIERI